jgi:hypothetical protein
MPSDPPKKARVFFRRDGKQVLVVAVHTNAAGLLIEADGPLSLTTWDDEALGDSILTALDQSTTVTRERPGDATLKVSGEPSPRAFEASFFPINVFGATEANLSYLLQGVVDKASNLVLSATLSSLAPAVDFARQATRIFQICRDRKF